MIRTLALLAAFLVASRADAAIVTYSFEFRTTGSVNGFAFADRPAAIAVTADTADARPYPFPTGDSYQAVSFASFAFSIQGFASPATFGIVGFLGIVPLDGGSSTNFVILGRNPLGNPGQVYANMIFAGSYPDALTTDTGPLAGGSGGFAVGTRPTSLGDLTINSNTAGSGVFRSQVVPEPASLSLLAVGLVFGWRWKYFQAA